MVNDCLRSSKLLLVKVSKIYKAEIYVFRYKTMAFRQFFYMKPSLYASVTVFVNFLNMFIENRHNHNEACMTDEL